MKRGFGIFLLHADSRRGRLSAVDEKEFLDAFLALKPELYHLSDGAKHTQLDSHSHLGAGSLDLPWLLSLVPKGGRVTLETGKNHAERLDDFIEDVRFAREAYGKAG